MARGLKRKQHTNHVSKRQAKAINERYLGSEPSGKLNESEYAVALNWYSYMIDHDQGRQYIVDYLVSKNRKAEAKAIKTVDKEWINMTVAKIARMWSRGVTLPNSKKRTAYFEERLQQMINEHSTPVVETKKKGGKDTPKVSIQDRVREKAHDIVGGIEEIVDRDERESVYDWLQANQVPALYSGWIVEKYQPWLDELYHVYWTRHDDNDHGHSADEAQLLEGYERETDESIVDRIVTLELIIRDAKRYGENAKKLRKPRKKRMQSVEKQIRHVKCQKEDKNFRIASIDPAKVLGAEQLWTFHTRTKIVTVFHAIDRAGLQFKRSSVANFDPKTSVSKRTGRKPDEVIKDVLDGGKITLRRVMEGLKKPTKLQTRITGQTILLRVV